MAWVRGTITQLVREGETLRVSIKSGANEYEAVVSAGGGAMDAKIGDEVAFDVTDGGKRVLAVDWLTHLGR